MREVTFPGKAVGSCSGRSSKACMTGFTSPSPSSPRSFQRRARPMTQCGQLKSDQTSIVIIRFSGSHAAPPPVLSPYSPLSSAARTGDTGFPFPLCRPAGKGADCLLFRGKKSGRPFPYKRKKRPLSCQPFQAVTRELPTISFRSFTMASLFFCFLSLPIPASLSS